MPTRRRKSRGMSTHEPRGLHSATFDDIRRLIDCLNDLHAVAVSARGRRLAAGLLEVMDAAAATVCVADGDAWAVVAVAKAGRSTGGVAGGTPPATPDTFRTNAIELSPPGGDGPAAAWSVRADEGPASALVVGRAEAFEPKHAALLDLLHPAVVWSLASSLATRNLPVGSEPVLELLLTGLPEKEIAQRLGRSTHTIHGHVKRLYRHFEVSSKSQLIHRHNRRGDV